MVGTFGRILAVTLEIATPEVASGSRNSVLIKGFYSLELHSKRRPERLLPLGGQHETP